MSNVVPLRPGSAGTVEIMYCNDPETGKPIYFFILLDTEYVNLVIHECYTAREVAIATNLLRYDGFVVMPEQSP